MRKVPSRIVSIEDLRQRAHARVPKPFMDYLESGSFSQITLRENRRDLDSIRFRERVMFDVSNRQLETTMLGEKVAIPVAIGPTGMCGAIWSNGEILSCRAAHEFGIPFSLSTNALLSIEDVRSSVDRPFWFQLNHEKDRGFSKDLLERAKAAGCPVLILTMDLHVEGTRYCDVHNGLDVLKFLGLGARACFIGRAYLYGLGAYGQAGVTKALEILKDELSVAMALTGVTDVTKVLCVFFFRC